MQKTLKNLVKFCFFSVTLLSLLAAIPFLIPIEKYHATLEDLVANGLGRQVKISSIRYRLFPFPHLEGNNVTIFAAGKGEAVIGRIGIWLDMSELVNKQIALRRIHFNSIATNQRFIESYINEWKSAQHSATAGSVITIRRISAASVTVRDNENKLIGPVRFDGRFGGPNGFESMRIALTDNSLAVEIRPLVDGLDLALIGRNISPPVEPPVSIDALTAHAIVLDNSVNVTDFRISAYDGHAEGDFTISWQPDEWLTTGRASVSSVDLTTVDRLLGGKAISGTLNGLFDFTLTANDPSQLLENPIVNGDLEIVDGEFYAPHPVFSFDRLTAQANLSRHKVLFSLLSVEGYEGSLTTRNASVSWQKDWQVTGEVVASSVDLNALLQPHIPYKTLTGSLNGTVDINLSGSNARQLFSNPTVDGNVTVNNATIYTVQSQDSGKIHSSPLLSLDKIALQARYTNRRVTAPHLELHGYGGMLKAQETVFSWDKHWHLESQIQPQRIQLAPLLARFLPDKIVSGTLDADAYIAFSAPESKNLFGNPTIDGSITVSDGVVYKSNTSLTTSDPDPPRQPRWLEFKQATGVGKLENAQLAFTSLTVNGYDGEFRSNNANLSWRKDWYLNGAIETENISLQPLLRNFLDDQIVAGTATATMAVKLRASTFSEIFDKPTIAGEFLVKDGVVYNADLEKVSRGQSSDHSPEDKTEFTELSGRLAMKKKKIRLTKVKIESPALRASGKVKINEKQELDGGLEVALRSTAGLVGIPLNIAGTVSSPSLSMTRGAMLGGAIGTSVLGPGLGTVIGVKTGKIFSAIGTLFKHNKDEIEKEEAEYRYEDEGKNEGRIQ